MTTTRILTDPEAAALLRRIGLAADRVDLDTFELERFTAAVGWRIALGDQAPPGSPPASAVEHTRRWLADIAADEDARGPLPPSVLIERALKGLRSPMPETVTPLDLDGLGLTAADDSASSSTVPALWGRPERMLATDRGRYALIFGNDGAGKTTTALRLALGVLGVLGFEELLGEPVARLADGLGVLYVSTDGPEEARANLGRMVDTDGRPAREVAGSRLYLLPRVPGNLATDERALLALVEAVEETTGQPFGLVVVDNAMRTYGNVTEPSLGGDAARSLGHVTSSGRSVVLVTQTRKGDEARKLEDAYASADLISGCGTAVSLFHSGAQAGGSGRLRHLKGYGSNPGTLAHYWTEAADGAMTLGEPPKGSRDRAEVEVEELAEGLLVDEWLTVAEVAERFGIAERTAARRVKTLEEQGGVESRPRAGKGGGHEYRGVRS